MQHLKSLQISHIASPILILQHLTVVFLHWRLTLPRRECFERWSPHHWGINRLRRSWRESLGGVLDRDRHPLKGWIGMDQRSADGVMKGTAL